MVQGGGRGGESGAARENGKSNPGNSLLYWLVASFCSEEKGAGFSCHNLEEF